MNIYSLFIYGCETWIIKSSEHRRNAAFELWSWRRLLRVPWAARRLNQSILKKINPEYTFEGLKLKLKYFWPPGEKIQLIGKYPDAGKD